MQFTDMNNTSLIFDSHAHYTSPQFAEDLPQLLDSLPQQGVDGVVECGVDFASSKASIDLAERWDYIYAAVGIHPECLIDPESSTTKQFAGDWQAELDAIAQLLDHPKVVAVGECGLDYHWPVPKEAQLAMFEAHLKLAVERDMPIIVHDRKAHADVYELLRRYQPKGVVHCFSGSAEDAVQLAKQGMYLGFGGAVTFQGAKRAVKAVCAVPLEYLVLETDCPYMAPVPCRGQRCDSSLIAYTAQFIAQQRGMDSEELLKITNQNARRLFGLPALSL